MRFVISPTKYIIYKYAKINNLKVPKNYMQILKKYEQAVKTEGMLIKFAWFYGNFKECINASSAFPHCIFLNVAWIVRVIFYDSQDTFQAFRGTIGHELTHKNGKDLSIIHIRKKDRLFIANLNECHADFGSAEKMFNCQRNLIAATIEFKKSLSKHPEREGYHPSWCKRQEYVQKYDFDEKLIRQIAADVGCTNESLIHKAICHFDIIRLN